MSQKESLRQKRLGQYFSGKKVSELLVNLLPNEYVFRTVIDPMVGSGDMLRAILDCKSGLHELYGIDIDSKAIENCKKENLEATVIMGDAFNCSEIFKKKGWDLVITNPPYVRYQLLNNNEEAGLPNAEQIRENLKSVIQNVENISEDDRNLLLSISDVYSGLSDMAVPAWILCSTIVKIGGYMAMVVPESWLNRDYAMPIYYLLLKLFDVEIVVKDVDSVWFDNASVRTCLVVAKRKTIIERLADHKEKTILIELTKDAIDTNSLVGNLCYEGEKGYAALERIIRAKKDISDSSFSCRYLNTALLFPTFINSMAKLSWVLNNDKQMVDKTVVLPEEMMGLLPDKTKYFLIEDRGWSVGQGLRTGANDFFYVDILGQANGIFDVQTRGWDKKIIRIHESNLKYALQNRGEIGGLVVNKKEISKAVIYIEKHVCRKDVNKLFNGTRDEWKLLEQELEAYICRAEKYVHPKKKKRFMDLSAVKPNIKKKDDGYVSFWYMMPKLQRRHTPDLCISRLSGKSPECLYINNDHDDRIVVDANFITLFNNDENNTLLLFALLNSLWSKCYLECIGNRMGGGALKIEASHLKKVFFPVLEEVKEEELIHCSQKFLAGLYDKDEFVNAINDIMFSIYEKSEEDNIKKQLINLLEKKKKERGISE